MTLPRPVLIAVLGGVLILAVFALTRMAATGGEEASATAEPAAQPADTGAVRSGRLDVSLVAREDGETAFSARFGGPFQSRGAAEAPAFALELTMSGDGQEQRLGAVSTGERAWVTSAGTAYELPAAAWEQISSVRAEIARLGAAKGEGDAPASIVDFSGLVSDEREVGVETVDGVETRHTRGRVDVAAALREIQRAASLQLETLPDELVRQIRQAVTGITADTWVGVDDGILRRFSLRFGFRPPRSARSELAGVENAEVELVVNLSEVNKPQSIPAPQGAGDPSQLDEADAGLALGIMGGAIVAIDPPPGADKVDPSRVSVGADGSLRETVDPAAIGAGDGLPGAVAKALRARRVVVLVLTQDGADDAAVRDAVRAVRGRRGVSVFSDRVEDIADYSRVVGELDIDRAPAVVVVRRDAKAEVIEGYVDAGTLVQQVEDAR